MFSFLKADLFRCQIFRSKFISVCVVHQVEDLFYNVTTRRNALKSSAAEHAKVVEVVSRCALIGSDELQ